MVTFDCEWTHSDGVTLVTARLAVPGPTSVTIRNCLDGPVWPPRRHGVPEAGWDETGFEAVVPGGSNVFGYAAPAEPATPPAELVDATPAPDADPATDHLSTVPGVCRELGDPAPPADVVGAVVEARGCADRIDQAPSPLPEQISAWFDTVERRVDRAETLADVQSLGDATAAVDALGGLDGVRTVSERADDERMLRAVARRAASLADRRADASVPIETLERLA